MRADGVDPMQDDKMLRMIINLAKSWIDSDNMHNFNGSKELSARLAEYVIQLRQQHQALLTQRGLAWMWTHWTHMEEHYLKAQGVPGSSAGTTGVPGSSAGTTVGPKIQPCPPLTEAPCPLMTVKEWSLYDMRRPCGSNSKWPPVR